MALHFKKKQEIINKISEISKNALSIVIADHCKITADQMNKLRKLSRENDVKIFVVRNTLMCRILKDTKFSSLIKIIKGPTLIAFSNIHPGSGARLFKEFSIKNTNFKIKAAVFEGKIILESQIDYLAKLPTKKEIILKLIITIKEASVGKLIKTLNEILNKKNKIDF